MEEGDEGREMWSDEMVFFSSKGNGTGLVLLYSNTHPSRWKNNINKSVK